MPVPRTRRTLGRALPRFATVALACALILVACGGNPEDSSASDELSTPDQGGTAAATATPTPTEDDQPSIDACALLTTREIEAVTGEKVASVIDELLPSEVTCSWPLERDADSALVLEVSVVVYDTQDEAESYWEVFVETAGFPQIEDIGDDAYVTGEEEVELQVLRGALVMTIGFQVQDESDRSDAEAWTRELAPIAAERLP
jgi:hypothetical protein